MTLDDLDKILRELEAGKGARVPYDVYELLFPPGEPDDGARGRAHTFARERNVKIDNRPDDNAVWFYKDA
ncbi:MULTISPECIES: hypothetical protein [Mesorhizobium]|uniref:hypothetical protein n=1 Tax=Mesorhizobium TaxID=68287 RepID=UPI0003FD2E15|nr:MULTISPECIES: hypothetical protein [Mesorhizobium]WJI36439.1 hypothetical protein NL534_21365 [Mesorhizobium opportunistum]